jgi:hypothetical protein
VRRNCRRVRIVYYRGTSRRANIVGGAVAAGLRHHGITAEIVDELAYSGPVADVAVFYGLAGNLKRLQREYVAAGLTTVFIDLGYWGRDEQGGVAGSHRVVVNALHATSYFQRQRHPAERFKRFRITTRPFKRCGGQVLLCGMSAKAAWVYDLAPEEWERGAVDELRAGTSRLIKYRPKPSWKDARPIQGATWDRPAVPDIGEVLGKSWACVTHHSNAALDALIAGVPVFCSEGLARPLASTDLSRIETPNYPDEADRDQLLFDAAYTQYTIAEIADGTMWRYLKDEALL